MWSNAFQLILSVNILLICYVTSERAALTAIFSSRMLQLDFSVGWERNSLPAVRPSEGAALALLWSRCRNWSWKSWWRSGPPQDESALLEKPLAARSIGIQKSSPLREVAGHMPKAVHAEHTLSQRTPAKCLSLQDMAEARSEHAFRSHRISLIGCFLQYLEGKCFFDGPKHDQPMQQLIGLIRVGLLCIRNYSSGVPQLSLSVPSPH